MALCSLRTTLGDGADGDGTGERDAPITITAIGAVGGRILIVRRTTIIADDRLCGPTGQVIAATGATVRLTIARQIVRGTTIPEIGPADTARHRHQGPTRAHQTGRYGQVRRNRHRQIALLDNRADPKIRIGKDRTGLPRLTERGQRHRTERQDSRAALQTRTARDQADPKHRTKRNRDSRT